MTVMEAGGVRILDLKLRVAKGLCAMKGCKVRTDLHPHRHPIKGEVALCRAHATEAGIEVPPPVEGAPTPFAGEIVSDDALTAMVVQARTPERDAAKGKEAEYAAMLADIRQATCESEADYARFGQGLVWVKGQIADLEARRKSVTGPLNRVVKEINAWFSPAVGLLQVVEKEAKARMLAYRAGLEATRVQALASIDDAATAPEVTTALATLEGAQVPTAPGITVSKPWVFRVVDESVVPREFLVVDESAIRRAVAAGVREIPGVEITQEERLSARAG